MQADEHELLLFQHLYSDIPVFEAYLSLILLSVITPPLYLFIFLSCYLTCGSTSPLSAVMIILKSDGEYVENCVFLHYGRLGLCLFQGNWSRVIREMFTARCSLIGSKGLLYILGPVDEPCFLIRWKQTDGESQAGLWTVYNYESALWHHPDVWINHLWF